MGRRKHYKRLNFTDRKAIEMMYRQNMGAEEIAAKLEVSPSTVRRELKLGQTRITDINGRSGYSANLAQNNADWLRVNKGRRRATSSDDETANKYAFVNRDL